MFDRGSFSQIGLWKECFEKEEQNRTKSIIVTAL